MELLGNRVFLLNSRQPGPASWMGSGPAAWRRKCNPGTLPIPPDLTNSRTCSKTAGCYLSCHFQRTYVCFCVGKHARHVVTPARKHQESRAASSENIACTTRPLRLHRSTCLCLEQCFWSSGEVEWHQFKFSNSPPCLQPGRKHQIELPHFPAYGPKPRAPNSMTKKKPKHFRNVSDATSCLGCSIPYFSCSEDPGWQGVAAGLPK